MARLPLDPSTLRKITQQRHADAELLHILHAAGTCVWIPLEAIREAFARRVPRERRKPQAMLRILVWRGFVAERGFHYRLTPAGRAAAQNAPTTSA